MDTKEKHIKENESRARHEAELEKEHAYGTPEQISESMPAEGKNHKRSDTGKVNRLWLWLGVICLILILIWWLFSMGIFEDYLGVFNGN